MLLLCLPHRFEHGPAVVEQGECQFDLSAPAFLHHVHYGQVDHVVEHMVQVPALLVIQLILTHLIVEDLPPVQLLAVMQEIYAQSSINWTSVCIAIRHSDGLEMNYLWPC